MIMRGLRKYGPCQRSGVGVGRVGSGSGSAGFSCVIPGEASSAPGGLLQIRGPAAKQ